MKIRQAKKILNRVLREPLQAGSNELESVYMPTIRRLYGVSRWLAAKNRVERWKAAETKRRFKVIIADFDLKEFSFVPLPTFPSPLIGVDWVAGDDHTAYTHHRLASCVMIPKSMLEESHVNFASEIARVHDRAYAKAMFRKLNSVLHEQESPCAYAANNTGNTHAASATSTDAMLEKLTELEVLRKSSDHDFDKAMYGLQYPLVADHLKPITRFLFLETAYRQCKEFLQQQSIGSADIGYGTIHGIAIERFGTVEEIETRADELLAVGDFGFRIIAKLKDGQS